VTDKPLLILIAGPYRSGTDGDSAGADQDVAIAHRRGLPVYYDVAEIPFRTPQEIA
jgi:hypothetical protein